MALPARSFTRSVAYRREVHERIPGGAHTYSKGDDQFPELSPAAIARGKHGRVWDLDGNEYVDCALGLGSVSLGHAYEPVLSAVRKQLDLGVNFQRPAVIELEFAREFLSAVPGAERIKFSKNGSTVTTAAVKLSRAFTGRDLVAFPGNHPFYSYDDWFIGSTVCKSGVPDSTRALSLTYDSTHPETLERLFSDHPGRIACVITEPEEICSSPPGALREAQKLARRHGAVFIVDEMVTGFRAGWPGAHARHGLEPDLVAWGKAIGNGFSICALTGRAGIMDLGGIRQEIAPRVFLISTTHGGETTGLAAGQAVLREFQPRDVLSRPRQRVESVAAGMRSAAAAARVSDFLEIHASSWRIVSVCLDGAGRPSPAFKTLLMQEMIGRGVLFHGYFLPCYTHTDEDVSQIVSAFEASCAVYRDALDQGMEKYLVGRPIRPVFRKYNGCAQVCPAMPCPLERECRGST